MALHLVIFDAAHGEILLGSVVGFTAEQQWQATRKTTWNRLETSLVFKKQTISGSEEILTSLLPGFSSRERGVMGDCCLPFPGLEMKSAK